MMQASKKETAATQPKTAQEKRAELIAAMGQFRPKNATPIQFYNYVREFCIMHNCSIDEAMERAPETWSNLSKDNRKLYNSEKHAALPIPVPRHLIYRALQMERAGRWKIGTSSANSGSNVLYSVESYAPPLKPSNKQIRLRAQQPRYDNLAESSPCSLDSPRTPPRWSSPTAGRSTAATAIAAVKSTTASAAAKSATAAAKSMAATAAAARSTTAAASTATASTAAAAPTASVPRKLRTLTPPEQRAQRAQKEKTKGSLSLTRILSEKSLKVKRSGRVKVVATPTHTVASPAAPAATATATATKRTPAVSSKEALSQASESPPKKARTTTKQRSKKKLSKKSSPIVAQKTEVKRKSSTKKNRKKKSVEKT